MSQKVHPKGFRLRSTGHPHNTGMKEIVGVWDSVWFSEPKKGKHFYTRILHEDQLIQDYTKGFFRSFGFYQQKCVIERKCNKELHITSYVLRTPKLQPSMRDNIGTRTRQEAVIQDGLKEGWIPFLIKSVISKILYDKSISCLLQPTAVKTQGENSSESSASEHGVFDTAGKLLKASLPNTKCLNFSGDAYVHEPSILPMLQTNSKTQLLTNQKRFSDFWNSWLLASNQSATGNMLNSEVPAQRANAWWTHRSWSSTIYYPNSPYGGIGGETPNLGDLYIRKNINSRRL